MKGKKKKQMFSFCLLSLKFFSIGLTVTLIYTLFNLLDFESSNKDNDKVITTKWYSKVFKKSTNIKLVFLKNSFYYTTVTLVCQIVKYEILNQNC